MLLADVARRANRPAEQLMWLDRAEHEVGVRGVSSVENLSFLRGQALLSLGRVAEAEAAFRAEIRLFPNNMRAWGSLAVVVSVQGRRAESQSILAEAVKVNDNETMRALAREALEVAGGRKPPTP